MSFSNYLELKILDHIVGKTSYAMPTAYVSLHTGDPGETGANECSGNGYARKSTAGSDWNAASSGSISNANDITFATPTGSWGTVSHFGIWDASSGGNFLAGGAVDVAQEPVSGNTVKFSGGTPGDLVITLD